MEPWRVCYRAMGAKLLLYARQFLSSDHLSVGMDAEDIVQTAFVRFWKQYPQAQPEQYGLLFAAVRTVALDALKGSFRRARREEIYSVEVCDFRDSAAVGREAWFESTSDQKFRSDALQSALSKLPEEQREVIVLKVWGEMTFAQIAEHVQESPNTVASRYRLGIGALKRRLTEGGGDGLGV